jgi:hypothetical protein
MESFYLYAHNYHDYDFDSLTRTLGWAVFCCSHFLPCPKYSDLASESRGPISILPESINVLPAAIGVLPAAVGRDHGPDLTTTRIHRSSGFRPVCCPTDLQSTYCLTTFLPIYRRTSYHPIQFPTTLSLYFNHHLLTSV